MSIEKPFEKILWCIDAFPQDLDFEKHSAKTLKGLTHAVQAHIEPVTVFPNLPGETRDQSLIEETKKRLAKYKIPNLTEIKVIGENLLFPPSISDQVDCVLGYADEAKADLLYVQTAARKGLQRLLLGSFTETLILQSKIPVLTVNPNTPLKRSFKKILYPTDFSVKSKETLPKVAGLAKALKAKITLFHAIEHPSINYYGPYGVLLQNMRSYMQEREEAAASVAKEWVKTLKDVGVKADFAIQGGKKEAAEINVAYAKKHDYSLIAMSSHTGPMTSALMGSTTRQVIRQAPCAVWAIHS